MGERAVGLLNALGYERVRHYRGGLEEWTERGGSLEAESASPPAPARARAAPASAPAPRDMSAAVIDMISRRSIVQLLQLWLWMITGFGLVYWAAGALGGEGLRSGGGPIAGGARGLLDAIYFSFVTALSIGYGDVVPMGPLRVLAILEGAAGLLIFGCVVSKLVSRRQDELLEQTHGIAFENRLGRVRTNLHLVMNEMQTLAEQCADTSRPPERVRTRLESVATIFAGELRVIHDLLYLPQQIPDEAILESILASMASALREMNELILCMTPSHLDSPMLRATLRETATLASEICGECVPRDYAPELKRWMDQIQEQSRRLA